MKCPQNCPYSGLGGSSGANDGQAKRPIIRHPQGNYISLQIPITIIYEHVADGRETTDEMIQPIFDVNVVLIRGNNELQITPDSVSVNNIVISDDGSLPIGRYDMAITFRAVSGVRYRHKLRTILCIIDSVEDGVSYESDEFDIFANYSIIRSRGTTIIVGDSDVIVNEGSGFAGDSNPNDGFADITATYGDGNISVGENDVTLTI